MKDFNEKKIIEDLERFKQALGENLELFKKALDEAVSDQFQEMVDAFDPAWMDEDKKSQTES